MQCLSQGSCDLPVNIYPSVRGFWFIPSTFKEFSQSASLSDLNKMRSAISLGVLLVVTVITEVRARPGDIVAHFKVDTKVHVPQTGFKPEHPDRGYIKNCGPGGGYFNMSWFPKEVSPLSQAQFYMDFVAPNDLDKGKITSGIWYEGNPVLSVKDTEISCDQLNSLMKTQVPGLHLPHLNCPIRAGQRIVGYFVYTKTQKLIGLDGNYVLKAEVKDEKGKQLLCLEMDLTVVALSVR